MMKKLLLTFLVSASIAITLFMTNMTVSASDANENISEPQSCVPIRGELQWEDVGHYKFHSQNIGGILYRGWLGKYGCLGICTYVGYLHPEPCPYPVPFTEPIDDLEVEVMNFYRLSI